MSPELESLNKPCQPFIPTIIAFCCNWCSYGAADLAGVNRTKYPTNLRIVRVMCSGMVHTDMVINSFLKGADGVMVLGCHMGDCHYINGNEKAARRAEVIKEILPDYGLEAQRFRIEWISAAEGGKFAQTAQEMTDLITKLGPNPLKVKGEPDAC